MAINWDTKDNWVEKRIGTAFANVFDDKNSMRALGRIDADDDWNPIIERFEETTYNELSFDELSLAEEKVVKGALKGDSNDTIAEDADLASNTVSVYKGDLVEEGYLKKEGWAEYGPGERIPEGIEERGLDEDGSEDQNGQEMEEFTRTGKNIKDNIKALLEQEGSFLQKNISDTLGYDPAYVSRTLSELEEQGEIKRERDGVRKEVKLPEDKSGENAVEEELESEGDYNEEHNEAEEAEKYGFSDVLNHFTGEDVLDEDTERYVENELEDIFDSSDGYQELLEVLNSGVNLKVLGSVKDVDSRMDLKDETDVSLEDVDRALEEFEEAGIVSTEEFKYSYVFEVDDEMYESALQTVRKIHNYVKNQDSIDYDEEAGEPDQEFTEWTEEEKKVLEEWAENGDLISSLIGRENKKELEKYRNGDREEIDVESHRLAEFENLPKYELILNVLEQENGGVYQSEIADKVDCGTDEIAEEIGKARDNGYDVLRVKEDDGFQVYLRETYDNEKRRQESGNLDIRRSDLEKQREEVLENGPEISQLLEGNGATTGNGLGEKVDPQSISLGTGSDAGKYGGLKHSAKKALRKEGGEMTYRELMAELNMDPDDAIRTAMVLEEENDAEMYQNGIALKDFDNSGLFTDYSA